MNWINMSNIDLVSDWLYKRIEHYDFSEISYDLYSSIEGIDCYTRIEFVVTIPTDNRLIRLVFESDTIIDFSEVIEAIKTVKERRRP